MKREVMQPAVTDRVVMDRAAMERVVMERAVMERRVITVHTPPGPPGPYYEPPSWEQ